MRNSHKVTVSLDSKILFPLRKKAAELDISLSALVASYLEKPTYDESTARLNEQLETLIEEVKTLIVSSDLNKPVQNGVNEIEGSNNGQANDPVTPVQMRAFMLETLLYLRRFTAKTDVGTRGDIAAEVRKYYGDNRVKGL